MTHRPPRLGLTFQRPKTVIVVDQRLRDVVGKMQRTLLRIENDFIA